MSSDEKKCVSGSCQSGLDGLSPAAKALWAKSSKEANAEGEQTWLPLHVHMADTAGLAAFIWDRWLSPGVKKLVADGLGAGLSEDDALAAARGLLIFLAAAHDLGKATPAFQGRNSLLAGEVKNMGLPISNDLDYRNAWHPFASQALLLEAGIDNTVAIVAGSHHGRPPNEDKDISSIQNSFFSHTGSRDPHWRRIHGELLEYAARLAGAHLPALKAMRLPVPVQVVLTAMVTVSDWLASDEENLVHFSLDGRHSPGEGRVKDALDRLNLPVPWIVNNPPAMSYDILTDRFWPESQDWKCRPLQKAVLDAFPNISRPGIAVIEAPMGEGKTEVALAAAEIFAAKTGRTGVYFALPTQATSDGLFPRLHSWVKRLYGKDWGGSGSHDILLAHGKSGLNKEYKGVPAKKIRGIGADSPNEGGDQSVVAYQWLKGNRKGALLAGFVVGTIDHVLMAGLRQKFVALRHLGLANKVVIIDECHAYDAYMNQYLLKVLRWLGAYGVPVIVLSATLPAERREKLVREYLRCTPKTPMGDADADQVVTAPNAYPLITYTDGGQIKKVAVGANEKRRDSVELVPLENEGSALAEKIAVVLAQGGCAGVVVNTVKRAQYLWKVIDDRMGKDTKVLLLHSRFLACDRQEREDWLRKALGRPGPDGVSPERPPRLVVVGTQVMEQSLDVDFDVLFSDLCPMDLLIQRIGRMHRHTRKNRPDAVRRPVCYVLGMEGDALDQSSKPYEDWPLLVARAMFKGNKVLRLPEDIAHWVNRAYTLTPGDVAAPVGQESLYQEAYGIFKDKVEEQKGKANGFQLPDPPRFDPRDSDDLTGWLADMRLNDASGKKGEATVRDTDPSVEVIMVERTENGIFCLLPHVAGTVMLPREGLDHRLARLVAGCSVFLPWTFTRNAGHAARVAEKLEHMNKGTVPPAWRQSPLLRDELFLVMERKSGSETPMAAVGGRFLGYDPMLGLFEPDAEASDGG